MIRSLIIRFFRTRRSAVALAMAIMAVPMLTCADIAVDFARISATRAILQAAVDSSTITAAGEYQMSESPHAAISVGTNIFTESTTELPYIASATAPNIALYCSSVATAAQCNATNDSTSYGRSFPTKCTAGDEYCVVVTAQVQVDNSIAGYIIPSELLTAISYTSVAFPSSGGNAGGAEGANVGTAGDYSSANAYAVPMTAAGGKPNYGQTPTPNSNCASSPGPIQYATFAPAGSGVTQCNYLYLGDSLGDNGNSGRLTSNPNQPIAFSFFNYSGKNEAEQMDATHYTTNLMVSTTATVSATTGLLTNAAYYPNGYTVPGTSTTCERHQVGCTPGITKPTPLYGQCPARNLYGSIYYSNGTAAANESGSPSYGYPGTPVSDALNELSTAYEELGYPPSYGTNHEITPFQSTYVPPAQSGYYVQAICPNWTIPTGTGVTNSINAPVGQDYINSGNPNVANANIFSTWYPTGLANEVAFTDSMATSTLLTYNNGVYPSDVYPPSVAACTPATSASDNGQLPSTFSTAATGWWGWDENNAIPSSTLATNVHAGYCAALESASYSNCAFIIQDLGTAVPTVTVAGVAETVLPDYYNIITKNSTAPSVAAGNIVALDPVYDGITYVDPLTGATIVNTDAAGDTPTNTTPLGPAQSSAPTDTTSPSPVAITASTVIPFGYTSGGVAATPFAGSTYIGDYIWIQQPAPRGDSPTYTPTSSVGGTDHDLPLLTNFTCYNPQANGIASGTYSGDANNGTAIDPVSNPQDGAVLCNTNPPHTYALYWNDMGGVGTDDLGYWNAVQGYTCSTPASTNAGGGGTLLSG